MAAAALKRGDEWRREYYATIGGSNAGTVLGLSRHKDKTPAKLWAKMAACIHSGEIPPDVPGNDDMRRGAYLEPVARARLSEDLGVEIREHPQDRFVYSDAFPFAHSLPDGNFADGGILELKVPRPQTIYKMRVSGAPGDWAAQCVHNAAVCGAPYCLLAAMDPITLSLETIRIEPKPHDIALLMDAEREFFLSVIERVPPAETDAATEIPADDTDCKAVVIDGPEAREAATQLLRVRALADDTEELEAHWKARLVELSNDALAFEIPGLIRVLHKPTSARKTFDSAAAVAKYPDLKAPEFWKTGKAPRPFIVRELNGAR